MPVAAAALDRERRYEEWYPFLLDEIAIVGKPGAPVIAIGRYVEKFLGQQGLREKTGERYKLAEWLQLWLAEVISPNREQKTYDRYEGVVRLHLVPHLGGMEVAKLAPRQVQDLETKLLNEGMDPIGVQMVHNVLSGAMKHALRMEIIFRDPVALVSPPSAPSTEAYSPGMEQVRALLAAGAASGHYVWPCVYLIIYTGLRRGEALALTWENLDLEERVLRVEASLVVAKGGGIVKCPKTESGCRTVNLDAASVSALREHKSRQQELAEQLGVEPPEWVFPRHDLSGWCHPNTLSYFVKSLSEKAGCPGVTMRSLRHFHASVALNSGQNPVVVSKRIGHSKVSTTMNTYAHALPGWQSETAEAVARLINADA